MIFEDVLSFLEQKHAITNRKFWSIQDSANNATIVLQANDGALSLPWLRSETGARIAFISGLG